MFVVAIANTKGGVGKTTLATHLAAHFALAGRRTALADLDRQRSSMSWLKRRPEDAAQIEGVDLSKGDGKVPKKIERLVVDAGAAMGSGAVKDVVQQADVIVIPTLPGAFDEDGTKRFISQLAKLKPIKKSKRAVCFVTNRARLRTKAVERLEEFLAEFQFPVVAHLRDTQLYVNAAQAGLTLFDQPSARHRPYLDEWAPLLDFLAAEAG